jgi:hypothetical protein
MAISQGFTNRPPNRSDIVAVRLSTATGGASRKCDGSLGGLAPWEYLEKPAKTGRKIECPAGGGRAAGDGGRPAGIIEIPLADGFILKSGREM